MTDVDPLKCMVVDDDHDGADVVGDFLQALGADVRVVYGGQQAIDLAPLFQPRMVILDLNMPRIDGFETCKELRQQQWARNVVIVAYTGLPNARAIAISAGFDYFVSKGDPPEILESILNGLAP